MRNSKNLPRANPNDSPMQEEQADQDQLKGIQRELDKFKAKHPECRCKFNKRICGGLKLFKRALEKSEAIGKYGWTIPCDATPREITYIIELISDEESVDYWPVDILCQLNI
jgi:hypothetical protein